MKSAYQIIRRPVITEKGLAIKENQNTLVFQVAPAATKTEIRQAVQSIFKVKVLSVRTATYPGKERRRGRERDVVGRGRADQLDERQHRDRVEEVHADEPLGVVEPGAHRGHGERRRVRGEDAVGRDDALDLARRPACLTSISSNTASSTRSQPAKTS